MLSTSAGVGAPIFCLKKVAFGGSYPRYVKAGVCGVGTCYSGTGFIGMNWLGTMGVAAGYFSVVMIACAGSINPPPLGLACFVKVIAFVKTLSNESIFAAGSLLRKIAVRWSIALK